MRLHRFYVAEQIGSRADISVQSTELANQIGRVFRLKVGDRVLLFDGSGSDFECEIAGDDKKSVTFRIVSKLPSRSRPHCKIFLCAAIVKKDNFEFIVEKSTELGVTDIIPVMAERSEKKSLNEERLKKIAIEASEQSGRGGVPEIHEIISLEQCIETMKKKDGVELIAFHTEGAAFNGKNLPKDKSVAVFIGPEGGWSPAELDLFHKNNIAVACLGPQILRAETAVVAALSQVVFGN